MAMTTNIAVDRITRLMENVWKYGREGRATHRSGKQVNPRNFFNFFILTLEQ